MTGWIKKASYHQIAYLILGIGFSLYFLSLLNGFVADDNVYIVGNPLIRNFNLNAFFMGSSYYSGDVNQLAGIYYKPIFTLLTSTLFNLSGGYPFFMRLVQISLHITNSFLLFLLFRKFFSKNISLFLSLVFLVHPGNTESAIYIADLQDVMFPFFGILALLVSLSEKLTPKKYLAVFSLLLLSLLSKESGILFLPTIVVLGFVKNRKNLKMFFTIPVLVFSVYLFMRLVVAHVYINKTIIAPIMAASLPVRLMTMPKIIYSYILLFVFPKNLSWGQHWIVSSPTFQNFYLPLFVILLVLAGLVLLFSKTSGSTRKSFIFFVSMIFFGLGLHAQIIPLDFTFAERWFYFPMIGFLGLIGVVLQNINWKKMNPSLTVFLVFCLLISLFMRSFVRTLDWKDDYTLATHDAKVDGQSFALENNLGYELIKRGEFSQAKIHLEKSNSLFPSQTSLNNLAFTYSKLGEKDKSLKVYEEAMGMGDFYLTYQNYIAELIRQKKYDEAKKELEKAFSKYPNNPKLWLLVTALDYNIGNINEAIAAAQRANLLSPGLGDFLLLKIQNKEPITL